MKFVGTLFNPRRDEDNETTFEVELEEENLSQEVEHIKGDLHQQDQGWILWELRKKSHNE